MIVVYVSCFFWFSGFPEHRQPLIELHSHSQAIASATAGLFILELEWYSLFSTTTVVYICVHM